MRIPKRTVLFLIAWVVWLLLSWVPDWQHVLVGAAVAALVAFMVGDLFVQRLDVLKQPRRWGYFLFSYMPLLIWEILKANIDVAYRVVHPKLPIHPGIVKIKTSLTSDVALTFLANSITLTPGTMSVDIDEDNGILYIHWIDVKTKDTQAATQIIAERFERVLKKIFEE